MNDDRNPWTVYPKPIFSRISVCMASSVWRPDPPRRRLPKIRVSGVISAGLMLSSSAMAAALRGMVRAMPDFMCAAGYVPSVAVDLSPGRRDDFACPRTTGKQQQFQRPCRRLGALTQLGEEPRQIPVPSQNLIRRLRAGMEEVREIEGSQFDTAPGRS